MIFILQKMEFVPILFIWSYRILSFAPFIPLCGMIPPSPEYQNGYLPKREDIPL